jgi:sortase A
MASGLLLYSGVGFWQRYRATHRDIPVISTQTITDSSDTPDESPVSSDRVYEVAEDQPRRIVLPSIGAEGFVQRVGVDQHGAIAVPGNVHMAGWFVGNDTPGSKGLGIIDGHVQGRYQTGVFKKLGQLKPGDNFELEYGDKSRKQFSVVSVTSYPVESVNEPLFKKLPSIEAQLNLITCGGIYDKRSGQYQERVLVVSKRTES